MRNFVVGPVRLLALFAAVLHGFVSGWQRDFAANAMLHVHGRLTTEITLP